MGRGPGVRAVSESSIQIDFIWLGKRCRERIKLPPTPANLRYATRLKATIDHEIATGRFDYAVHFPESPRARGEAGPLLGRKLDAFCDSLSGSIEPETLKKYRSDAGTMADAFPSATIQSITAKEVREWVNRQTLSKKRLDNLLIPLRGALKQAYEDGEIPANPLAGFEVKRTRKPVSRIDPYSPAEVAALAKIRPMWEFWAWTGLRSGEILGLRWGDVGKTLTVSRSIRVGREKAPKTASGTRVVALLPAALAALSRMTWGDDSDPLFANHEGKHFHEDRAVARLFKLDCDKAGVRYRGPNQLRHTYATWALSSGENPAWIARQMGHTDTMMLFRVYGKWMPQLDPMAGSKMVSAMAALGQHDT